MNLVNLPRKTLAKRPKTIVPLFKVHVVTLVTKNGFYCANRYNTHLLKPPHQVRKIGWENNFQFLCLCTPPWGF